MVDAVRRPVGHDFTHQPLVLEIRVIELEQGLRVSQIGGVAARAHYTGHLNVGLA